MTVGGFRNQRFTLKSGEIALAAPPDAHDAQLSNGPFEVELNAQIDTNSSAKQNQTLTPSANDQTGGLHP